MFRLSVVVLLSLLSTGEALGLPLRLATKDLALAPLSIQHRNLQDSCEQALEGLVSQRYDSISGVRSACSCSTSSATCDSVFPETCALVDCTMPETECVESGATSVQVCFQQKVRVTFSLDVNSFTGQGTAEETNRVGTTLYTQGVDNVCDLVESYSFTPGTAGGSAPTSCNVLWDLEECNSCTICDPVAGATSAVRQVDCSNIDPDAIDTDCVPETDNVDFQVLKFNSSASCDCFPSDKLSGGGCGTGTTTSDASTLVTVMMYLVISATYLAISFW